MISLRQHAISLVAVFLALAVGLFLGSGFIGDSVNSVTGTSRDRIGDLEKERDELNQQLGIRMIALDRPGYGLSDYQENRTYLDWPGDVSALADHLALTALQCWAGVRAAHTQPRLHTRSLSASP